MLDGVEAGPAPHVAPRARAVAVDLDEMIGHRVTRCRLTEIAEHGVEPTDDRVDACRQSRQFGPDEQPGRRGRDEQSAIDAICRSWNRSNAALGLLGLAPYPNETPREHALRAGVAPGIDPRVLDELALHATAAIYGDLGDHVVALRCAELADEVVLAVKDLMGPAV